MEAGYWKIYHTASIYKYRAQNQNRLFLHLGNFLSLHVPQEITLLRQGFGRLIRSTTDTGVVAILDPHIKSKFYASTFKLTFRLRKSI